MGHVLMNDIEFRRFADRFRGTSLPDEQLEYLVCKVLAPTVRPDSKYRVRLETKA